MRKGLFPGLYRITRAGASENSKTYKITVPMNIAEAIGLEQHFKPELTEEGLLYRPVPPPTEEVIKKPSWIKEKAA
jgi:hypothetical protein